MPNFGPIPSDSDSSLHGVLHSMKLPSNLADRIDIYDARDAIEACGGLWGDEKEDCYAIFGVDPAADFWYDVVFKLETSLEMDTFPEEDALHHGQERC
ncbi:hypothetical protein Ndes2526B_g07319 [Nannochloris sp. 'desiccata']|nr:hypothetical protein KSW81_004665 [Chlorella desiccata (nom. nud.)]KAH7618381.1 hypothetical protein NADE_000575 [Chlorella desiccata (nom. nud.)]